VKGNIIPKVLLTYEETFKNKLSCLICFHDATLRIASIHHSPAKCMSFKGKHPLWVTRACLWKLLRHVMKQMKWNILNGISNKQKYLESYFSKAGNIRGVKH